MSTHPHRFAKLRKYIWAPLSRNAFYLILQNAVVSVFGFVFWIVVSRFFSPLQVGVVSALMAAIMLLMTISRLGLDIALIRFLSSEPDKQRLINSCLTAAALISLGFSLIFIAGLDFWSPALSFLYRDIPFFLSFVIFTVACSLLAIVSGVFVAFRRAEFTLIQGTARGVLQVVLPLVMVAAGSFGLFFSWGIAACLVFAMSVVIFIPKLQPGYRPLPVLDKRIMKEVRHFSSASYVAFTLENGTVSILPLVIINLLTPEATAYFRIAWAVSSVLFLTVPSAICTSLFAESSHDMQDLRQNVTYAGKLALGLFVPVIAVLFLFGQSILSIFGSQYAENALPLMLLLTVSCVPYMLSHLYMAVRMVQMVMKPVILIQALVAVLAIGISVALIPKMGIIATGIGWTLSHTVVALMITVLVIARRKVYLPKEHFPNQVV